LYFSGLNFIWGDNVTVKRFGAVSLLKEVILFFPHLLQLILALLCHKSVPFLNKAIFCFMIMYLMSPGDILPDFIPVVGQLDDIVLLLFAVKKLLNSVENDVFFEKWNGNPYLLKKIYNFLQSILQMLGINIITAVSKQKIRELI